MAQTLTGKVSWFGGPNDPSAGSQTASGASVNQPGIAVYNHATLGGWWRVQFPNGRVVVLKQTDIGPAPWTGRKVDVTSSALGKAGYTEGNFPTDSTVTATFLGNNPGAAAQAPSGPPGSSTKTTPGVNNQQARNDLMAQYLLQEANAPMISMRNAMSGNAIKSTLAQSSSLLATLEKIAQLKDTPARTITTQQPGQGNMQGPSGSAKSMFQGGYSLRRIDQGQDLQAKPGAAVFAPGNGYVVAVPSDPGGFGPSYPVIHWTSGPFAGKTTYIGHTLANVRPGQQIKAGQVVSHTGTSGVGNATSPGWAEVGFWGSGGPGGMGAGSAIAPFFK